MDKANRQACAMALVAATCVICSLMADAGTDPAGAADKAKEATTSLKDVDSKLKIARSDYYETLAELQSADTTQGLQDVVSQAADKGYDLSKDIDFSDPNFSP